MVAERLLRLASLLPLLALVACGGQTSETGERGADGSDTPKPPMSKPASVCGDRLGQARPFGVVTLEAQRTARNACGDVAFVDASGGVWAERIEMSAPTKVGSVPPSLVAGTRLALSHTGKYLAYSSDDGVHQVALDVREAEQIFAADQGDDIGFAHSAADGVIPPADTLVLCGKARGLRSSSLAPAQTTGECTGLLTGPGPFAVARIGSGDRPQIVSLEVSSGAVHGFAELTEEATSGGSVSGPSVALSLSMDGHTLLVERTEIEASGDYFARTNLTVQLVFLPTHTTGVPFALQWGQVGNLSVRDFFAPAGPHRLAFAGYQSALWQDVAGVSHTTTRTKLLTIDPAGTDGIFLDSRDKTGALLRAPLVSGGTTVPATILSTNVGEARGSDDLAHLVVAKIPTDGVRYPDKPSVSHAQLWEVARLDALGETVFATSTQPLSPLWVGEDGASIVRGALADVPLPKVSAPENMPPETYGFHAFDATGSRLRSVSLPDAQTIRSARRGLVVDHFRVDEGYRFHFVSAAGEAIPLASAGASALGSVEERFFDAAGEILVATGAGRGAVATRVVLAGALPR